MFIYEYWEQYREKKGWKPFSYYRTPADDEGLEKLTYLSLYSLKYGIGAGLVDGLTFSNASGASQFIIRIGYWTVPLAMSCWAFVGTNHVLAKVTGKDTAYNHALSGVAAASVWGAKFRSLKVGFPLALVAATWCTIKKMCVDQGIQMSGTPTGYPEYVHLAQMHDMTYMRAPKEDDLNILKVYVAWVPGH